MQRFALSLQLDLRPPDGKRLAINASLRLQGLGIEGSLPVRSDGGLQGLRVKVRDVHRDRVFPLQKQEAVLQPLLEGFVLADKQIVGNVDPLGRQPIAGQLYFDELDLRFIHPLDARNIELLRRRFLQLAEGLVHLLRRGRRPADLRVPRCRRRLIGRSDSTTRSHQRGRGVAASRDDDGVGLLFGGRARLDQQRRG